MSATTDNQRIEWIEWLPSAVVLILAASVAWSASTMKRVTRLSVYSSRQGPPLSLWQIAAIRLTTSFVIFSRAFCRRPLHPAMMLAACLSSYSSSLQGPPAPGSRKREQTTRFVHHIFHNFDSTLVKESNHNKAFTPDKVATKRTFYTAQSTGFLHWSKWRQKRLFTPYKSSRKKGFLPVQSSPR